MATNIPYQFGIHTSGYVTPDVKASEGFNSVGKFYPAPWLPLVRYNEEMFADVVISRGKPLAFAGPYLVPAGLKLELDAVVGGGAATILYTIEDVKKQVKNAAGVLVTAGEAVVQSLIDEDIGISYFAGIANYDYFRHPGGDGFTPTGFDRYNFRPQSSVSFNMDYHYEYPMVLTNADYAAAPLTGVSAFVGTDVKPGYFITYDKNSNFVVTATDFSYGTTAPEAIIGQVTIVHILKDFVTKEVVQSIGDLHRVVTPENFSGNPLDQLPGTATGGMTQKVEYANAVGLVHFGLQTR